MATYFKDVAPERSYDLAREWAAEVKGWHGARGGWIYSRGGATVTQGWGAVWSRNKREIMNWLTFKLTSFDSFEEMVEWANASYRPTIMFRNWRYQALAEAYNQAQRSRVDPRRAFVGQAQAAWNDKQGRLDEYAVRARRESDRRPRISSGLAWAIR